MQELQAKALNTHSIEGLGLHLKVATIIRGRVATIVGLTIWRIRIQIFFSLRMRLCSAKLDKVYMVMRKGA